MCFVIPTGRVDPVLESIRHELSKEIERRDVDRVWARHDVVIITAVGAGMRGMPGVAARVCGALANAGINILVIAQGSSEYSISLVVEAQDNAKAVQSLHHLIIA
jgi:aspartate kinase